MYCSEKTILRLVLVAVMILVSSSITAAESAKEYLRDGKDQAALPAAQQVITSTPADGSAVAPDAASVHWSVLASGGGQVNLGSLKLGATIGQTVAGNVSLGGGRLISGFWQNFAVESESCCIGRVGDANGIGGDEPTIGDVSVMVDAKFISLTCDGFIVCLAEGDINQNGGLDPVCDDISIGDISILVDYLFISQQPSLLVDCL